VEQVVVGNPDQPLDFNLNASTVQTRLTQKLTQFFDLGAITPV
jgi:hypothetical protein